MRTVGLATDGARFGVLAGVVVTGNLEWTLFTNCGRSTRRR